MCCWICKQNKDEKSFSPSEKKRIKSRCNACQNAAQKARFQSLDVAAREKFRAANKQSYHRNKDKYGKRKTLYYMNNYDTFMYTKTKTYARKRGATEFLSRTEWDLFQQRTTCHWCNILLHQSFTNVDHIIPVSDGGQHTLENLAKSCANCNAQREWNRRIKYKQQSVELPKE